MAQATAAIFNAGKDDVIVRTQFMAQSEQLSGRSISGRRLVVAMFAMGILATATIWTYWTVRMTPFMPLQEALIEEFPDSRPYAEGGSLKKSGRSVLKVVLKTDFDPTSEQAADQVTARLDRTRELAEKLAELSTYEVMALHLYYPQKERGISQQTFFRDVVTWAELDAVELVGWEPDPQREKRPETE